MKYPGIHLGPPLERGEANREASSASPHPQVLVCDKENKDAWTGVSAQSAAAVS